MSRVWDIFRGKEKDSESTTSTYEKPESVDLSEKLFDIYKSAREEWAKQAKEDDDFRKGAQWTLEQKSALIQARQNPIVVNVLEPAVEQAKAMLTANKPRFTSTAREDSDTKTGKVFADLMSYIWDQSNGNMHLKMAIDDYYVKGMGVLMAYIDPYADFGKGEVKIASVDPFDLYADPNSKDPYLRDSAHIIISKHMTREQLLDLFPNSEEYLENASSDEGNDHPGSLRYDGKNENPDTRDLYHERFRVIDRYSKMKVIKWNVFDPENGEEKILNDQEFAEYLESPALRVVQGDQEQLVFREKDLEYWMQVFEAGGGLFHYMVNPETGQPELMPGPIHEQAIPDSQGRIELATMADVIQAELLIPNRIIVNRIKRVLSFGGVKYSEEILPIEDYPIVTLMNHYHRSPYPLSDVRMVRDLQQQINKIESLLIAHASNSTNVKIVVPRGGVDKEQFEKEFNKAGTAVLEVDTEMGDFKIVAPPALPSELYKNKADKIAEIERILGIYALMQGDAQDAPNTYKGTVALDEYGQRRIKSKKDDIESALNAFARVIVQLIQKTYTEPKVIRLVQPNNLPTRELAINQPLYNDFGEQIKKINDVTVGRYDVILVSGSMLPSNRWAVAEYYKELLQIGAIDQQEFLMKTEVADVEGVLARFGQMNQMQQMIEQLQEEVKKLQGDQQTKDREISHLMKKVEVEKFKADLADPRQSVRKSAQLYDQRQQDQLSMMEKEWSLIKQQEKSKDTKNK